MTVAERREHTLVLTGTDVRELLTLPECIGAIERVLALHARGGTPEPAVLGLRTPTGGFHVKAAAADLGRFYFVAKTNGNFPDNPRQRGLPSIQGVIVLCDATDGRPLAILDSMEVTTLRTGAATAVAAKLLALPDRAVVTIVGCGVQGRVQLRSVAAVRQVERVFAVDAEEEAARRFAGEMAEALGVEVTPVPDVAPAARESHICVTCTPSRSPLLGPNDVRPGAFVAGVGADHPDKHELAPELLRRATVVVDAIEQAAAFGDLHHALAAGIVTREVVRGELGQIVAGSRPGRSSSSEVFVFDSTGTALQDVAAAALVYERAVAAGRGVALDLAG